MNEETSADIAAADQHLSESEALKYFQAASLYRQRTRFVGAVHCAVDHAELDAKAGQPGRERQASRAGTNNQDVKHEVEAVTAQDAGPGPATGPRPPQKGVVRPTL
jgi:hypothetical protein